MPKKILAPIIRRLLQITTFFVLFWVMAQFALTPAYADGPVPLPDTASWIEPVPQGSTLSGAWGDMDSDGDLDLVVGQHDDVIIYLNQGLDAKGQPQLVSQGASPFTPETSSRVALGDVDNDGDLDVAVGKYSVGSTIYLNNSLLDGKVDLTPANWSEPPAPPDLSNTYAVAWSDINGDGQLDLTVGNARHAEDIGITTIYLNTTPPGGPVQLTSVFTADGNTKSVAWGDLDRDGDLDLAIAGDFDWRLFINEAGTLNPIAVLTVPNSSFNDGFTDLAWGDMDGDGFLELAISRFWGSPEVYAFEKANNRWLADPVWSDPNVSAGRAASVSLAWADVDNDGDMDLAVEYGEDPDKVYLNVDGTLQTGNVWQADAIFGGQHLAWADVNGDSNPDLTTVGDSTITVYLNQGSGLPTTSAVVGGFKTSTTSDMAWGDIDNDGELELAVGTYANSLPLNHGVGPLVLNVAAPNFIYRYRNGVLEQDPAAWNPAGEHRTNALAWGDVNNDGWLDLAVANAPQEAGQKNGDPPVVTNDGVNEIYLNNNGVLANTPAVTLGNGDEKTTTLAWADINGDGDLDLATGNFDGSTDIYLNNNGQIQDPPTWRLPAGKTINLAFGDIDNDGDLDLAVAKYWPDDRVEIYRNNGGQLIGLPDHTVTMVKPWSLAFGDVDGDGDLDLAVGVDGGPKKIYPNQNGVIQAAPAWNSGDADFKSKVAFGDVNSDGYPDLAAGNGPDFFVPKENKIYLNHNGELSQAASWVANESSLTGAVAWGDANGDGRLDLAFGGDIVDKVYLNQQLLEPHPTTGPTVAINAPKLAPANLYATPAIQQLGLIPITYTLSGPTNNIFGLARAVYSPNGGGQWFPAINRDTLTSTVGPLTLTTQIISAQVNTNLAFDGVDDYVDIPDMNPDYSGGFTVETWVRYNSLDALASIIDFGNGAGEQHIFLAIAPGDNLPDLYKLARKDELVFQLRDSNGGFEQITAPYTLTANKWLHLAAAIDSENNGTIYVNGQVVASKTLTLPNTVLRTRNLIGNNWQGQAFFNGDMREIRIWNTARSQPEIRNAMSQSLSGNEAGLVSYWPFNEGSGATAIDQTDQTGNGFNGQLGGGNDEQKPRWDQTYTPPRYANTYVYNWDVLRSGFFGQSDNVVFRLEAYPGYTPTLNSVADSYLYPYAATQSYPFRVRGTQVQVLSGTTPVSGALVYRLPQGKSVGGLALRGRENFTTDQNGFLQGQGQIEVGDQLLALAPVDLPPEAKTRFGKAMSLYYTNGTPIDNGLTAYTVTKPGLQTLVVSSTNPLMLFDLDVSLEWDASSDPAYRSQLEFDLKRASEHLYDFTNGQAALGDIYVYQNAERWSKSHILVHSTNRLRPHATIGGVVLTNTADISPTLGITYSIGQVHMGSVWNRYGNPAQSIGVDWPVILAHELGHYLFFLEDTYLGLEEFDGAEVLTSVDSCRGSAMGDVYNINNTEFVGNNTLWQLNCGETLAAEELGRTEWQTMVGYYPWLKQPPGTMPGPSQMPFDLTTVSVFEPLFPTGAIEDPTFYLDYRQREVSSSEARAFLLRNAEGTGSGIDDFDYVYDLGNPVGGQNRVLARGATPGDRLCVFDHARNQFGCEIIAPGDERLGLRKDPAWQPVIQISPVNSTTFELQVSGVVTGLDLKARLFPEFGEAFAVTTLFPVDGGYTGTLTLDYPALKGHVQVWADNDPTAPRRETMVAYRVGGNPGNERSGGGNERSGGGNERSGGGNERSGGGNERSGGGNERSGGGNERSGGGDVRGEGNAPAVSPDGQMIYFDRNYDLAEGQFYTVQVMAGLPPLPEGKTAIGWGYNLFATGFGPNSLTGSVSFQYRGNDVLAEERSETELGIYFWDGQHWRSLNTNVDTIYNMASARSQGPGIYALLAGVTAPVINTVTPAGDTNEIDQEIVITGRNFLEPVHVTLIGPTAIYTLPLQTVSPVSITAVVSRNLPAGQYDVRVINGNQPGGQATAIASGAYAIFDPVENACFFDTFESGSSKWELDGEWNLVNLSDGGAITDSPDGNYNSATGPDPLRVTSITTKQPIDLSTCSNPVLTFRHDYVLARLGSSWDRARVQISTNGRSWRNLRSPYLRGGVYNSGYVANTVRPESTQEWSDAAWKSETIDLSRFAGKEVYLRFLMQTDRTVADKGWVIDDVIVRSASTGGN